MDAFKASMMEGAEEEGADAAMVKMMFGDVFIASEIKTERTLKSLSIMKTTAKETIILSYGNSILLKTTAKQNECDTQNK